MEAELLLYRTTRAANYCLEEYFTDATPPMLERL